jgi:SAM-dependent methyltransferase
VAVDESGAMLDIARAAVPDAEVVIARLQDELPPGPFDLVVSAFAVHHLDGAEKADLFRRVAQRLAPNGRFVLGDVVVPDDPAEADVPLEAGYDRPDRVADQLRWLADAGLAAGVVWAQRDLAIVVAELGG